ncbi:TSUP family transporter [Geodermatophilus telluris]|uniref:TSUP family transporter n=1 Tax=Geodermatophilus telluris TaxID=1190417 RepID=UPI0015874318|nr:TSUP family transporter [Geodermatophilus telluris]
MLRVALHAAVGEGREVSGAWLPTLGLAAAVAAGAVTQRVTGLGFSLVAAPFLVLLTGPVTGVLVANALGVAVALLVLGQVYRDVDLRRGVLLLVPALAAVVPGALLARAVPVAVLQVLVGGTVVLSLLAVLALGRWGVGGPPGPAHPGTTLVAGAATGFLTATAGVGGPALTAYAVATRWAQSAFAATAQLCFAAVGATAVAVRGMPVLPGTTWASAAAALAAGVVGGTALATRVPPAVARTGALTIALAGGLATVVDGLLGG